MRNVKDTHDKASRALLVGHFSTVGDVEVLRQIERWLDALGMDYDVSPYTDARLSVDRSWLDRLTLDPTRYTHLIVICGPFTPEMAVQHDSIFGRFQHCVHIGVNLTMVRSVAEFNPFEVLLERDSDRTVRADLSFRETRQKYRSWVFALWGPSANMVSGSEATWQRKSCAALFETRVLRLLSWIRRCLPKPTALVCPMRHSSRQFAVVLTPCSRPGFMAWFWR